MTRCKKCGKAEHTGKCIFTIGVSAIEKLKEDAEKATVDIETLKTKVK